MKPVISEFSYGFAIVNELLKQTAWGFNAVPVFPSLYQEGQTGGGYDVFLDSTILPLFLQFKLSDCMVRTTADEVSKGLLNVPFYRMPLRSRTKSQQHELLLNLEDLGNAVFYVAPRFWSADDFNLSFLNSRIIDDAIFVRPSSIGQITDDEDHHVAFEPTADIGYFCSQPTKLKSGISFRDQLGYLRDAFEEYSFELTMKEGMNLLQNMKNIVQGDLWVKAARGPVKTQPATKAAKDDRLTGIMEQLQFISRCYFGCDMLLLKETK